MRHELNNIDDLFKAGLGGYTEVPPPDVWAALEQRLDNDKKKRPFGWRWFVVLLLCAVVAGSAFIWSANHSGELSPALRENSVASVQQATTAQTNTNGGNTSAGHSNHTVANNTNNRHKKHITNTTNDTKITTTNADGIAGTNNTSTVTGTADKKENILDHSAMAAASAEPAGEKHNGNHNTNKDAAIQYIKSNSRHNNIAVAEMEDEPQVAQAGNAIAYNDEDEDNMTFGRRHSVHETTNEYHATPKVAVHTSTSYASHNTGSGYGRNKTRRDGKNDRNSDVVAYNRGTAQKAVETHMPGNSAISGAGTGNKAVASSTSQARTNTPAANVTPSAVANDNGVTAGKSTGQPAATTTTAKPGVTNNTVAAVDKKTATTEPGKDEHKKTAEGNQRTAIAASPTQRHTAKPTAIAKENTIAAVTTQKRAAAAASHNILASATTKTINAPTKHITVSTGEPGSVAVSNTATTPAAKTTAHRRTKGNTDNSIAPALHKSTGNAVAVLAASQGAGKAVHAHKTATGKSNITTTGGVKTTRSKAATGNNNSTSVAATETHSEPAPAGPSKHAAKQSSSTAVTSTHKTTGRKTTDAAKGSKPAPAGNAVVSATKNKHTSKGNKKAAAVDTRTADLALNSAPEKPAQQPAATPAQPEKTQPVSQPASKPAATPPVVTSKPADTVALAVTAAPATDSTSKKHRWGTFSYGIKGGYEGGISRSSSNKVVISPYIERQISTRLSLMAQPAFKYARVQSNALNGSKSYYKVDPNGSMIALDSVIVPVVQNNQMVGYLVRVNLAYREQHDSIVKTYATGGSYMELELPILLKYAITPNLSVYGGVNLNYSRYVSIKENTNTIRAITVYDTTFTILPTQAPSIGSVINYTGTNINNYSGPLYPGQSGGIFRMGYMLGMSYELKKRWMIDALIQQSGAKSNVLGGYDVNKPLSSMYFRVTLGYRLSR